MIGMMYTLGLAVMTFLIGCMIGYYSREKAEAEVEEEVIELDELGIDVPVGATCRFNGVKHVCVADDKQKHESTYSCVSCSLGKAGGCDTVFCGCFIREDKTYVSFKLKK